MNLDPRIGPSPAREYAMVPAVVRAHQTTDQKPQRDSWALARALREARGERYA